MQIFVQTNTHSTFASSTTELQERFADVVAPIAAKHNMSLDAFGTTVGLEAPRWGHVKLSDAFQSALEPAPVTPTAGSGPYELLSGTILSTLKTNLRTDNLPDEVVVSPGLSLGTLQFDSSYRSRSDVYIRLL